MLGALGPSLPEWRIQPTLYVPVTGWGTTTSHFPVSVGRGFIPAAGCGRYRQILLRRGRGIPPVGLPGSPVCFPARCPFLCLGFVSSVQDGPENPIKNPAMESIAGFFDWNFFGFCLAAAEGPAALLPQRVMHGSKDWSFFAYFLCKESRCKEGTKLKLRQRSGCPRWPGRRCPGRYGTSRRR